MQPVSRAYKSQIKKVPFRNRSFAEVIVGVINKEAQEGVSFDETIEYMEYSNLISPLLKKAGVESEYATYEPNYFIPNGEMSFVGTPYTNQGAVEKDLGASITLDLGREYSLSGLTIDFGSNFLTKFNLVLDNETITIENDKKEWIYATPITTRFITIEPISFNGGGNDRLRIESFKCGYFKTFSNNEILSLDYEETISPISDELSQTGITLKTENFGRKYDVELESDLTKFFIVGQDVNANFGYELDDGTIEYLDLGNLSLKSWEIDSTTLILKGTSYINTLDDTCMIGEYSEEGKTLYDLAVEVFNDLGIRPESYIIDNRMKGYTTHNPLPQLPHSQILQILANAGQCAVLRDRNNMYKILPTGFVNSEDIQFTVTDNGHTPNSTPQKIINIEGAKTNYIADYSQDYFRVTGEMYFTGNENQGYISNVLSDENGDFTVNPKITITINKAFQVLGWTFDFVDAIPKQMKITSYYNNQMVEEYTYDITQQKYRLDDPLGYCDKVEIEILKGSPNARVHIAEIMATPIVFEFTTEKDVIGSSKAKVEDIIKNVELEATMYEPQETTNEAYKEEITIEEGLDYSNWEVIFNSPIIPDQFFINNVEITPIAYTGQHCIIDLSSYTIDDVLDFRVSGKQLTTKTKTYRTQINEKGLTNTYQNPMIDNDLDAKSNLVWLGIYNNFNKTYTIQSRGYPELEANDLVGLEIPQLNKFATLRLVSQKITFSGGGLRGTNIARREV